jgi:hypothetical protein
MLNRPLISNGFFPLAGDSAWHYTGDGQPGSSPDDDFTWTVLPQTIEVAPGVFATRILTTTDEPDDSRSEDEDFWVLDEEGQLLFYGIHNGQADGGGTFPPQDVILDDPLLVGGRGMTIGQVIVDTVSASAIIVPPIVGVQTVEATVISTITYVEFLPIFETGLGPLTDVLHLTVEISGTATFIPPIGPPFMVEIPLTDAEFFLKEGLGMVGQDQSADLNDAEQQVIDQGRVGGVDQTIPQQVSYDVTLDTDQAITRLVAGGSATIDLDTVADTLTYDIECSGLSSMENGSHIHGNAPPGNNAGILHSLPPGSPKIGVWNYAPEEEYGILAGLTYINIHTENNPSGEIRGQIEGGIAVIDENAAIDWLLYE